MAYETYTLPSQVVPAGTIGFTVITSNGTGSTVLTDSREKYFSSDFTITDATELLGGDIQSGYASFKIDHDYNNLFSGTLLPILETVGEYVLIKVTLNGNVLFYGAIEPSTISKIPFYATDDNISNAEYEISFKCVWAISLLKFIPTTSETDTDSLVYLMNQQYNYFITQTFPGAANNKVWWMALSNIIKTIFQKWSTVYGFTYSLTFDQTDYTFFGRDGQRGGAQSTYTYPYESGIDTIDGNIDFATFENDYGIGVPYYLDYDPNPDLEQRSVHAVGVFYSENSTYLPTAYDVFVGILKSLGLYCHISYGSGYDFIIKIGTRISQEPTAINDVLEFESSPFTEASRNKINLTSSVCGNTFVKTNKKIGSSEYTDQFKFDFHDDNAWLGSVFGLFNGEQSLMYPASDNSRFHLIRQMGIGGNLLSNPNFDGSLSGWTQDTGTWTNGVVIGKYRAVGDLDATAYVEISQTLSETVYDNLIFSIRLGKIDVTAAMTVEFQFYSGSQLMFSETKSLEASYTGLDILLHATYRNPYLLSKYERTFGGITKVKLKITQYVANYVYITDTQLKVERQSTEELVGYLIDDYFNNPTAQKRKYVLNGIKTGILPRQYHIVGTENYYVKARELSMSENKTTVETVNYPQ